MFGRTRMRLWELTRTYVFFWLIVPVVFVGPIVLGAVRSQNSQGEGDNSVSRSGG